MATSKLRTTDVARTGDRHSLAGKWNGPVYRARGGKTLWLAFSEEGLPIFTFATDRGEKRVLLREGDVFEFTLADGTTRVVATLLELSVGEDRFRHRLRLEKADRQAGLDIRMTTTITTLGYLELDEVMSVEEHTVTTGYVSYPDGTPIPQVAVPAEVCEGVLMRD